MQVDLLDWFVALVNRNVNEDWLINWLIVCLNKWNLKKSWLIPWNSALKPLQALLADTYSLRDTKVHENGKVSKMHFYFTTSFILSQFLEYEQNKTKKQQLQPHTYIHFFLVLAILFSFDFNLFSLIIVLTSGRIFSFLFIS